MRPQIPREPQFTWMHAGERSTLLVWLGSQVMRSGAPGSCVAPGAKDFSGVYGTSEVMP